MDSEEWKEEKIVLILHAQKKAYPGETTYTEDFRFTEGALFDPTEKFFLVDDRDNKGGGERPVFLALSLEKFERFTVVREEKD